MADRSVRPLGPFPARHMWRLLIAALCCGTIISGVAGCAVPEPGGGTGAERGTGPASGSAQGGASGLPASSAEMLSASQGDAQARACRSGRVELSYRLQESRSGRICVKAGTELVIKLQESPGHAWTAVESLSPHVVRVLHSGRGASLTATARAVTPGEAELRWTASFTGDRFGPPTLLWRLTVVVVG